MPDLARTHQPAADVDRTHPQPPEPLPDRPRLTLVPRRPDARLLFPGWGPTLWR